MQEIDLKMLAIYTRLSKDDKDKESNSIANQKREGIEFAKREGLEYKIYDEGKGVSGGASIEDRPVLKQLFEDLPNLTAVWVRDQNRIERDTGTWGAFSNAIAVLDIAYYESGKKIDLQDPDQWAMTAMKSVWNTRQRRSQIKHTKKALRDNAAEGKAHGMTPFGYSKDENKKLIVNEAEAEVVRKIYHLSLHGMGTIKIAEELNRIGVPTRYQGCDGTYKTRHGRIYDKSSAKWAGGTIRAMIANPIYKGVRKWGEETFKCPIIVEPSYWEKVNSNLKNNANNSGKKVEHKYLLKGLVKCKKCGRNYYGRSRESKKDHYYMCSGKRRGVKEGEVCKNRSVGIDFLEGLIWGYFISQGVFLKELNKYFDSLNKSNRVNEIKQEEAALKTELGKVYTRKNNLLSAIEEEVISHEDARGRMQSIRTEAADIKGKLSRLDEQVKALELISKEQDEIKDETKRAKELPWSKRKEFLKKYIDRIEIQSVDPIERTYIEVFPSLEGMTSTTFIAPYTRKYAIEVRDEEIIDASGYYDQTFSSGGFANFDPDRELVILAENFVRA